MENFKELATWVPTQSNTILNSLLDIADKICIDCTYTSDCEGCSIREICDTINNEMSKRHDKK